MATMTADEYREIAKAIINTATGGSASGSYPWNALNKGNYSAQDFYDLMQARSVKNAGYDAILNADGSVRTYTYINKNGQIANLGSYDDIAGAFNSNHQTGTASGGTIRYTQPIDTSLTVPTETEPAAVKSAGTMTKYADSVKGVGNFVFGSVLPAICAASTGIALGKTVDSLLYNANPDFWNKHGMETLNPDTWKSITAGSNSLGAEAFNMIFGINPDTGDTQMYMDENAFAYMSNYLQNIGVFNPETSHTADSDFNVSGTTYTIKNSPQLSFNEGLPKDNIFVMGENTNEEQYTSYEVIDFSSDAKFIWSSYLWKPEHPVIRYIVASDKPFRIKRTINYSANNNRIDMLSPINTLGTSDNDITNKYPLYNYLTGEVPSYGSQNFYPELLNNIYQYIDDTIQFSSKVNNVNADYNATTAFNFMYGNRVTTSGIDGINTQEGAKIPSLSNDDTIEQTLQKLKEQYPELWNTRVENNVVQPDGTTKTYTYIPVPMPTGGTEDQPTTEGAKQSHPAVDPSTATDTLLNTLVQILTQTKPVGMTDTPTDPINPNPPDVGGGDTPVVVVPTGSANALYSIYNPSQSQLNSFGAWLWSADFVDQIKKLFNDPMQAIIGLHKVFATPPISGSGTIKVGYLDSGVASNIVGNQYTTVDCGSVNLYEYYGNVFDYDPFTKINLYLPFIGIVPLNVGEIMRSTIHIIYHVDVLTGACLAEIKITRDSAGGTLFQYSGNAAVQYPISSGSYMGIISGIMSIAGGIAGTVATGGAAMPVLLGAGASAGRMHTDISHSGSFSGNAGAMGIKKPYLIIDRPQTALAKNFPNYIGYPSNSTVTLLSCNGYTKVHEIHLENIPATNDELTDIEMKLKNGVII